MAEAYGICEHGGIGCHHRKSGEATRHAGSDSPYVTGNMLLGAVSDTASGATGKLAGHANALSPSSCHTGLPTNLFSLVNMHAKR